MPPVSPHLPPLPTMEQGVPVRHSSLLTRHRSTSWHLDIHQRPVLLPTIDIRIVDIARNRGTWNGDLDRIRRVVVDDRNHLRRQAVGAREPLGADELRVAHLEIALAVLEYDVERELERTRVLAAYELRQLPEFRHLTLSRTRC